MSKKINFDYTKALSFFSQTEIDYFAAPVKLALNSCITRAEPAPITWAGLISLQRMTRKNSPAFSRLPRKSRATPKC